MSFSSVHITYMVLAHKDPSQLLRLIKALNNSNVSFVVHIDASVNMKKFKEYLYEEPNIWFLEERISTAWGTYGIIEACLTGFKYISEQLNTSRVVLLSGQDYPIKPQKHIHSYFSANTSSIFIEYIKLPHSKWLHGGWSRFPDFRNIRQIKTIYGGSQWCSFPIDTLKFILSYLQNNHEFISYFKTVVLPDESFFQTLLLNCDNDSVINNLVNCKLKMIKWDKPYMNPRVLTTSDKNIIRKSKDLFARKFHTIMSKDLLNFIDASILNNSYGVISETVDDCGDKQEQVVLFFTNRIGPLTWSKYNSLKSEFSNFGKVEFLLDETSYSSIPKDVLALSPILIDDSIADDLGYTSNLSLSLPTKSSYFPLLKYYRDNPYYDYYWFILDDKDCVFDWTVFFSLYNVYENDSDFLSSHIKNYDEEPNWQFWHTLEYKQKQVASYMKVKACNQIFRISNSAIEFLDHCLSNGWTGHHESLFPTLLKKGGFSIADFKENENFVSPSPIDKSFITGLNTPTKEVNMEITGSISLILKTKENCIVPSINKRTQIISFLTNKDSNAILTQYHEIKKKVGNLSDTILLFHQDPMSEPKPALYASNPFFFTSHILTELGYKSHDGSSLGGSNHFPLIKFYREHPNYAYYWYIEDDVRCLMGWDNFFEFFSKADISSDFLSSHVRDYAEEPDWFWWDTLKFNSSPQVNSIKIRSFNPIFRISNAALNFIDQCHSNGWQGHFEVLLPSLLKMGGFNIAEFGGAGKYVLPGCENRFYTVADADCCGKMVTWKYAVSPRHPKS